MINIPLANPSRELDHISNFKDKFDQQIRGGVYVGGENVNNFESNFKGFIGSKYCVSLNSGTDALILSLIALGIKKGDRVLVPSFTFFSTVECVLHLGAIPVFVDINLQNFTIDLDDFVEKANTQIKAAIPVHLFGNDSQITEIKKICSKRNIKLVEDVAQAFGSRDEKNNNLGSIGDIGAFSFFPSKTLGGIGDGGCITTDDYQIYKKIKMMKNHGQIKNYEHEIVGGNSRLDSLNAFVLNEKLDIFSKIRLTRNKFCEYYVDHLKDIEWISLPEKNNSETVLNYFTIRVPTNIRSKLMNYLSSKNIGNAVYYKRPVHLQKVITNNSKKIKLKNTEIASKSVLSLPLYSFPNDDELEYIVSTLRKFK